MNDPLTDLSEYRGDLVLCPEPGTAGDREPGRP